MEWVQGDHITLEKNRRLLQGRQAVPRRGRVPVPARGPEPHRGAARGRARTGSTRCRSSSCSTLSTRPVVHLRHVGHGGHPGLPGAEHGQGAVRQQARPAGGRTGRSTGRRSATSRTSGAGEVGDRGGADGLTLVRRHDPYAASEHRGGQGEGLLQRPASTTPLTIKYLGLPQYPELLKTGRGRARAAQGRSASTMDIEQVDVSVWFDAFVKGDYQITSAYQERTIDPDNFYALVLRTRRRHQHHGLLEPAVRRSHRPGADRDRRRRQEASCTSRSGRSCTTTRRSSSRTTRRSTT